MQAKKFDDLSEIFVDESTFFGYNSFNIDSQAVKGRVSLQNPFREPRLVRWGTVENAEHGPGAAQAIGSLRRERPLLRRGMLVLSEAMSVRAL